MGKGIHIFSAEFTQPLVNWVHALRGFAGLAPFSPDGFPNRSAKTRLATKSFRAPKDLNVWFIDDDPINNILNCSLMEDHFPEVQLAIFQDARQALNELEKVKMPVPDLIFLDLNMPGFNGWDFMEVFIQRAYSAKVFILTSSIDPEDRNEASFSKNIAGFYSKPLLPEMIKDAFEKTARQ
jgi:CheY-like chemotaxis protein